ncbi:hypothetical protein COUCH_23150 [Couchioplanes caeruleus]|uniref:hypothetical protein n=1 Tax=Couchioplanes caeruleus TaxID=56438 RepID=UPI0020C08A4D|nr:hypothetical protein [Couchioplanes caeruleus]UQU61936.1 hypothetical protein COUCH_23150 [Couchioplanes caeruleus]
MPYLLGIEIGETTVAAAMCRRSSPPHGRAPQAAGEAAWGPAEPVTLAASAPVVATSLGLSPGGDLVAAEGTAGAGQHASGPAAQRASGFVHRIGGDIAVHLAGEAVRPETLMAGMVGWVAGRLWQLQGKAPERIAVAHPTGWGPYRLGLVRTALDEIGLGDPALVPRAGAVVTGFQAAGRLPAGAAVLLVLRLDGAGLEVSLIQPHAPGQYEFITSAWWADLAGSVLDAADPAGQRAVLRAAVDLAARTAGACALAPADVSAVLLAGSAAGHPLFADLLAQAFPAPVLQLGDPRLTVACGAALALRPRSRPEPADGRALPEYPTAEAPLVTATEPLPPGPVGAMPPPRPPVRVIEAPAARR